MAEDFVISGLFDRLASHYHVITPDRPGFGYTERPRDRFWTEAELGRDARTLNRALWSALPEAERVERLERLWAIVQSSADIALDQKESYPQVPALLDWEPAVGLLEQAEELVPTEFAKARIPETWGATRSHVDGTRRSGRRPERARDAKRGRSPQRLSGARRGRPVDV